MLKRYTFLKHPFYFVLENAGQMVGGLEKCIGVFCDENNELEAISYNNGLNKINIENSDFFNALRKSKAKFNWIKPEQVPFEIKTTHTEQLTFTDEESSSVLELHFPSKIDANYDVLYFYFKANIGNFKLTSSNQAMAVAIKEVIQNLLYNQIRLILETNYNNAEIHHNIAPTINNTGLINQINDLKEENFSRIKEIYQYLLTNLTLAETTEFALSKEAIIKLASSNLSLTNIEKVLKASLEILINKYNLKDFHELTHHDIITVNIIPQEQHSIKEQNLNKTALFLDKYENAAKILHAKNEKITGFNIGNNCYPAISPAAISDILKKHHSKISLLLQQHPNKWAIIRSSFKPISSISEKFNSERLNKLGA